MCCINHCLTNLFPVSKHHPLLTAIQLLTRSNNMQLFFTFHCALCYIVYYTCTLPVLLVEALYYLPDGNQQNFMHPPRPAHTLGGVVDCYLAGGTCRDKVLTKYGALEYWDMRHVTNMNYIFAHEGTNGLLGANAQFNGDVSYWNTSGVTTMIGSKFLDVFYSTCNFYHAIVVSLLTG